MIVSVMFKYNRQYIFKDLVNINKDIYIFEQLVEMYYPRIKHNFDKCDLNVNY